MGKFDGYLLLSDFDGTLYHKDNQISAENCEAIRYFQSEGGLFALASGRTPNWLLKWNRFIVPNTYSAMMNGAILCDEKGEAYLYKCPIHNDFLEMAERILQACPAYNTAYMAGDEIYVPTEKNKPLTDLVLPEHVYKMVFHIPSEYSDEYTAKIKEIVGNRYIVMRSWSDYIEVQNAETGKGNAILRLKNVLGERARVAVAVGDYENDIDMIKTADVGYAVANAHPMLKAVADRMTVSCAEHAVAAVIADIERGL